MSRTRDDVSAHLSLWGGRFENGPADELMRINRSLPVDWRLWQYELEVDRAWVNALAAAGTLSAMDAVEIHRGLRAVAKRFESESPKDEPDEDVHTLIERWLFAEVGDLASQVRVGRSRNDVVATDTRMWARDALSRTEKNIRGVQEALLSAAEAAIEVRFPAYSHLQRAQPTRAPVWLLSHFWSLHRDRERLCNVWQRVNQLPLGAAAGMGTSVLVDRENLAQSLGFEAVIENSLDAVQSRDWVSEVLFLAAQTAGDLSRLAEDLVIYSSHEFGLIDLGDRFTTGSSLMPQKRNPDGAELARASGGVLLGLMVGAMSTFKGLPSGYNKDLQEDKSALFEADRRLTEALQVMRGTVESLEFDVERCRECLDASTLATDVADALVSKGFRFGEAHQLAGRLVRFAEHSGVQVAAVSARDRFQIHPALADLPAETWEIEDAIERRNERGGSSREAVEDQIRRARVSLSGKPVGPDPATVPGVA